MGGQMLPSKPPIDRLLYPYTPMVQPIIYRLNLFSIRVLLSVIRFAMLVSVRQYLPRHLLMRIFSFGDFKMTDKKIIESTVTAPIAPEVIPAHVDARSLYVANLVAGITTAKGYADTLDVLFEGFSWVDWKGNGSAKSCNMTKEQFDVVAGERKALKSALAIGMNVEEKKLNNFDSKWQYIVTNSAITLERKRLQDIQDVIDAAKKPAADAKAAADAPEGDTPEGDTPEGDTPEKTNLERMLQHLDDALRFATKEGCGCAVTTAEKIRAIQLDEKKLSILSPTKPAAADS